MNSTAFYQGHLNQVSRSFAFCIEQLQQPLRDQIALAYILCRMVDTVEDARWAHPSLQRESFARFSDFLHIPPAEEAVRAWAEDFPATIPQREKDLLHDAFRFFNDFHELAPPVRNVFFRSLMNMNRGMVHFTHLHGEDGSLALSSLQETNQYCFFVAGVVGELLTELVSLQSPSFTSDEKRLEQAAHFGLFLQKINLLKDQMTDLEEGRHLIGDREALRQSLAWHAHHALSYILDIPPERRDFRIFCAWSFFLGVISLPFIDRSWHEKKPVKISRAEAFLFLNKVKNHIDDPARLKAFFDEQAPVLGDWSPPEGLSSAPWFHQVYSGPLGPLPFASLGIASAPAARTAAESGPMNREKPSSNGLSPLKH